jgi:hypothetical protein
MSAKGKLTQVEKYAIQGMLSDGKTIAEVEEALDRAGGVSVKNYVMGELDELISNIVEVRLARVDKGEPAEEVFDDIDEDYQDEDDDVEEVEEKSTTGNKVISSRELIQKRLEIENNPIELDEALEGETLVKLRGVGMKQNKAQDLLNRAKKQLNRQPKDAAEMFNFCLRQLNMLDHMVTTTSNPRTGDPAVAIMTGAASALADDIGGQRRTSNKNQSNRPARNNIFRPKNGDFK